MVKHLRRNCDNLKCGKQYRYRSPASKTCSAACRSVVSRQRRAEEDKAEREQRVAEVAAMLRQRQIDAQIAPPAAPAPPPASRARPARREAKPISRLFPPPAEKPARITIRNVPTRFPGTPLRGRW